DTAARMTSITHQDSGNNNLALYTYTYNLASDLATQRETTFNPTSQTYDTYTYDANQELTNDSLHTYTYDLNGNRTMSGYQTTTPNELTNDGTWTYTYDNEGNLIKKSKGASAETWFYGYDNANRLVSAKKEPTDGGPVTVQATYVFDALGNRVEKDIFQ